MADIPPTQPLQLQPNSTPPAADSDNTPKMTGILDLAPELVEIISTNIHSPEDFGNFRLACRYLEECSHKIFGENFYAQQSADLGRNGLERLVEISKHESFAGYIKKLRILVLQDVDLKDFAHSEAPSRWERGQRIKSSKNQHGYTTQGDFQLLCKALQGLISLTEVSMGERTVYFAPPPRRIFVRDLRLDRNRTQCSYAFSLLSLALSYTSLRIETLKATMSIDGWAVDDALAREKSFESLKNLSLCGINDNRWKALEREADAPQLTRLLTGKDSLKVLNIESMRSGFFGYLATCHLVKDGTLSALTSLRLSGCDFEAVIFCLFLKRHKNTLRDLRLQYVGLDGQNVLQDHLLSPDHQLTTICLRYLYHSGRTLLFREPQQPADQDCKKHWTSEDPRLQSHCHLCEHFRFEMTNVDSNTIREAAREGPFTWLRAYY